LTLSDCDLTSDAIALFLGSGVYRCVAVERSEMAVCLAFGR